MRSYHRTPGMKRHGEIVVLVLILLAVLPVIVAIFLSKTSHLRETRNRSATVKMDPALMAPAERRVALKTEEPAARKEKPKWVDEPPASEGTTRTRVIEVGPFTSNEECIAALHEELQKITREYMTAKMGMEITPNGRPTGQELAMMTVKDEWTETLDTSVGPMLRRYSLVKFDKEYRNAVDGLWRDAVVGKRQALTWLASGGVLLAIGGVYSVLRRKEANSQNRPSPN